MTWVAPPVRDLNGGPPHQRRLAATRPSLTARQPVPIGAIAQIVDRRENPENRFHDVCPLHKKARRRISFAAFGNALCLYAIRQPAEGREGYA